MCVYICMYTYIQGLHELGHDGEVEGEDGQDVVLASAGHKYIYIYIYI